MGDIFQLCVVKHRPYFPVFRSKHQAELLMWLLLHPDQEYGVSDLADRLGVPLSTMHREVVRLDEAGLITSRTLGRNRLVRANAAHPAGPALTQLLEVTFGPKVVIAEEFAIPGAEQVVIFGSVRRSSRSAAARRRCARGRQGRPCRRLRGCRSSADPTRPRREPGRSFRAAVGGPC